MWWHNYRSGRVKASVPEEVYNLRDEMLPISFIKNVYYKSKITSVATDCGNEKESDTRNKYCKFMSNSYTNYSVNFSCLILNPDFCCLVASPDDIVNCSCCGVEILVTKCPSKYRDNSIEDAFGSCLYLEFDNGEVLEIINTHAYYYQIQIQLLVTQYDY